MNHLIGNQFLPLADLKWILARARSHLASPIATNGLAGKCIFQLFYEASTRTRASFDVAAARLGATSSHYKSEDLSVQKGESFADSLRTLAAMNPFCIVVRHPADLAWQMAEKAVGQKVNLIDAGSGKFSHPTPSLARPARHSQQPPGRENRQAKPKDRGCRRHSPLEGNPLFCGSLPSSWRL